MRLWCGLLIALLGPASARAATPLLVYTRTHESSSGPRGRASRLQDRLARQLGAQVLQGPAAVARVRRVLGRRASPLAAARLNRLVAAVKAGAEHGYAGDWKRAVTTLQSARQGLMGDVLSVARQRRLLRTLQRARLLLVMCYLRLKQPRRGWAMMEEALKTQPDLSPSGALYGPALLRLYYRVKAQLDLQKGRLRVVTTPPGALIFLNGRSMGFSPVTVQGLYPGVYDLLVVKGKQHSRIRRFRLGSKLTTQRVDLGLEQAVILGRRLALRASAGARWGDTVLRRALRLGQLVGVQRVLLVGAHRLGAGTALWARLVDCRKGTVLRAAYVSGKGVEPDDDRIGRLGRYLLGGGNPEPGVVRLSTAPFRRAPLKAAPTKGAGVARPNGAMTGYGVAGWILLGGGLVTVGAGGLLWGLDGRTRLGAARDADRYSTQQAGMVTLGVGLGVAALGAVLLIVDAVKRRRRAPEHTRVPVLPLLSPARGGCSVGLRARF